MAWCTALSKAVHSEIIDCGLRLHSFTHYHHHSGLKSNAESGDQLGKALYERRMLLLRESFNACFSSGSVAHSAIVFSYQKTVSSGLVV